MGGKVARKAQVALFVLIGVILVIGIILAIYLINQRQTATVAASNTEELFRENPACRAEVGQMQERANGCLERTLAQVVQDYAAEEWLPESLAELEEYLSEELAIEFPACFQEWPINDRLAIVGDEPDVELTLSDAGMGVTVIFATRGECDEQPYTFTTYVGTSDTTPLPEWEAADEVRDELLDDASDFFDDDCAFDPYAKADEDLYADVVYLEDGRRIVYLYDYTDYDGSEEPSPVEIPLPACDGGALI